MTLKEPADEHIDRLCRLVIQRHSPYEAILCDAAADSYKRLISPQMEREIRNELTAQAEKQAIDVFAENLRHVLLQPPFAGQTILGLDPGFRTGCKAAIIDATGRVLAYGTYYLTKSAYQKEQSAKTLARMIQKYGVTLISIGNGTASYETEQFVSSSSPITSYPAATSSPTKPAHPSIPPRTWPGKNCRTWTSPSAAPSPLPAASRTPWPNRSRSTAGHRRRPVSARRQPESLVGRPGPGRHVGRQLCRVDLNTASAALLQHISGLTAATAANIVAYRDENGPFQNRQDLLNVPRLGPATFTQCAGFLRIKDGSEPLDNTSVHPESYGLAEKIASHYGLSHEDLKDPDKLAGLRDKIQMNAAPKLAAVLDAGEPTIKDILEELRKPGRDVRSEFPKPLTRRHVMSLDDLQIGTVVRGTVQNVVDFGAFVDFG